MVTRISIQQAEFFAFHGYYEEERKAGNQFYIDAEVVVDNISGQSDQLANTINYEQLYRICSDEMSHTKQLLESVVSAIIARLKNEFPQLTTARVRLEKVAPQLGGKVGKAVVEMEI